MKFITKNDFQDELRSRLNDKWVLSTADLEVTDSRGQVHLFDVALHTGDYVFGRITVGPLSRARLPGVKEKRCTRIEDIDQCISWAVTLQEMSCRRKVVMNASQSQFAVA